MCVLDGFLLDVLQKEEAIGMIEERREDMSIVSAMNDYYIASLWGEADNEHILLSFLNGVLESLHQPKIVKAALLNRKALLDHEGQKPVELDIHVRDENGTEYDIEVQKARPAYFIARALYYWSKDFEAQLKEGDKSYGKLKPVKVIAVADFPLFSRLKNVLSVFNVCSEENPQILLTPLFQMIFVRVDDFARNKVDIGGLTEDMRAWVNFFAYADKKEVAEMSSLVDSIPEVQEAYARLRRYSSDPSKRWEIERDERFVRDVYSWVEEGEEKGKAENIRKMKSKGLSSDYIAEILDLTVAEVEKI
jgi:predicted transposase/invertase (TIGR01784 family)